MLAKGASGWIVDVDSEARALEIAAEVATAPGQPVKAPDSSTIDALWIEVCEILGRREDLA